MKSLKTIALILLAYSNYAIANDNLKFNWGSSHTVVTEKITKDKAVFKIKYDISLEKHSKGYIVKQTNLDFIAPIPPPGKEAEKTKLLSAMALPDLLVDRKGNPLDVIDFDGYINRISSFYENPQALQMFQSPQIRQMLYAKAQQNWCLWVCNWTNLDVKEGKPITETSTTEISGMSLPTTTNIEIRKNWENSKNVKLTMTSTIGGEAAIRELTNFIQILARENKATIKSDGNSNSDINEFSKGTKVTAIIDPTTLKPFSIVSEELTQISTPTETKSTKEKHEYMFEWK